MCGHDLRLAATTRPPPPRPSSSSATTSCAPSRRRRREQQRPGAARHRHLDLHRDVRPGPVPGARRAELRRRRLGARHDPDAADRQGRGRHRRVARTARGTRRRGARSSPTGSGVPFEDVEVLHGDTQIAPKGLDTYGSRSLVVGGEALVKAADKVIEKAKADRGAPARGQRRRPRVRRRPVHRQGHRQGRRRSPRSRSRPSPATTCPTASSRRSTPTRRSTRTTSPSRTAPTCARWRSTPRPAPRRCASTSASTTSARSSTR